jgi:glutamate synthase domain-containing protein 3
MTGGRVIVLGPVGRNFAAGMSGGVAYLWDVDERSRSRVNLDMVDLEGLDDPDEAAEVRALIEEHARLTGSRRAAAVLAEWHEQVRHFVKVMPRDYRRALEEQAAETAAAAVAA